MVRPSTAKHGEPSVPDRIVTGTSEAMRCLLQHIAATASSGMATLLLGETGTGKELFARVIHNFGPRSRAAFVSINCATVSAEIFDAALVASAKGGGASIYLDGVSELSELLQGKLLRFLQEREIAPVAGKNTVRIISASNRDLDALVNDGRFRGDLYYRLCALQFRIPPLRDRRQDIPMLVPAITAQAAADYGKNVRGVSPEALAQLIEHDWPGNIRELENEIRRAVLICGDKESIQPHHLGMFRSHAQSQSPPHSPGPRTLKVAIEEIERAEIICAIEAASGNQSQAAKLLGITRNGLALKIRRLSLTDLPLRRKN
jgi:transcriptional regulator with PAS, ATPase and Fis domain